MVLMDGAILLKFTQCFVSNAKKNLNHCIKSLYGPVRSKFFQQGVQIQSIFSLFQIKESTDHRRVVTRIRYLFSIRAENLFYAPLYFKMVML